MLHPPSRKTQILETLATRGRTALVRLLPDRDAEAVLEGLVVAGLVEREKTTARLTRRGVLAVREARARASMREDAGLEIGWDDVLHLDGLHGSPRRFAMILSWPVVFGLVVVVVWRSCS